MRPRAHYRKPKKAKQTIVSTIRIVITFATIALLGMVFYFAWKDGWEAVFAWFGGKYACMIVIILTVAVTIAVWLLEVVKRMRGLSKDE